MSKPMQGTTTYNKMTQDLSATGSTNLEYSMLLQRPAPVKSQDINHVLTSALRDVLSQDKLCMKTVDNLVTSKGSKDQYHEKYVDLLNQVCKEREKRMAQISMLECHLMQVQAKVVSADERMLNTFKSLGGYDALDIPKGYSCYRAYVNSKLLKENGLIAPDDYIKDEMLEISKRLVSKTGDSSSTKHKGKKVRPTSLDAEKVEPNYLHTTTSWLNHNCEKIELYPDTIKEQPHSPNAGTKFSTPELQLHAKRKISIEQSNVILKMVSKKEHSARSSEKQLKDDLMVQMSAQVNFLQNPRYRRLTGKNRPKLLTEVLEDRGDQHSHPSAASQDEQSPHLLPTPKEILFTNYRTGEIYEAKLELKNISSVLRPCKVIPPASKYFVVGLGQFPNQQGLVAPGMSCIYTIRFAPDTFGTFKDKLQVVTQSSKHITVPLLAKRPHPILTLPSVLDIGFCLIGNVLVTQVIVKNIGGSGCFCMMPADLWKTTEFKMYVHQDVICVPPFSIRPATFGMRKDLVGVIEVKFEPVVVGKYSCKLAIVCDNCEVKYFTIIGQCQKAKVMLVEHEGVCSKPLPNESYDSLANHLIRFKDTNSFSYEQKSITIKNCTSIDFPFFWFSVKPNFQNSSKFKPKKIAEKNSAFRVFPNYGHLKANAKKKFQIIFAPEKIGSFDCVWHMVLEEPPNHKDFMTDSQTSTERRHSLQLLKNIEKEIQKRITMSLLGETADLMLAMKGRCVPFQILIQPYALFIHEPILIGSTEQRQIQIINNSVNEVNFHWQCEDSDIFVIQMKPTEGTVEPGNAEECQLCFTGYKPEKVNICLKCYIEYQEDPILYQFQASIKGPEVIIENSSIDFGLVCLGDCVLKEMNLQNKSPVPAEFRITQIPEPETDPVNLNVTITSGILDPYQFLSINMSFAPDSVYSLRTNLLLEVVDGSTSIIAVRGEVEVPHVVLESCELDMGAISCGIKSKFSVSLINNSYVEAQYEWLKPVGSQACLCKIKIIPQRGIIGPRNEECFNLNFFSNKQMVFNDVFMQCRVIEMHNLLCLAIKADVKGLIIQYKVSKDWNFTDVSDDDDDDKPVILDFGEEIMVASKPSLYLRIKNVTKIESTYAVSAENFPVDNSLFQPSKKGLRVNAKLQKPFTSTLTKLTNNESCRDKANVTQLNGAGLLIEPLFGRLPALSHVIVKVTIISSMWGNYRDNLICRTGDLDVVRIPVVFNVVGSPLEFLIVGPASIEEPKIRFGFCIAGMKPLKRNVRIYNNSVFDIRIDWRVFNIFKDDSRIVDLNLFYGDPFPLLGPDGKNLPKVEFSKETPIKSQRKRVKIINVTCSPHVGISSNDVFEVTPKQMIIKGNSDACLVVKYITPKVDDATHPYSYLSYACGFLSLDHEQQKIDSKKGITRPVGWNKTPLRIHMTADILVARLTVEFFTDDQLFVEATLGEIFSFDQEPETHHKVFTLKLLNEQEAVMSFTLAVNHPFSFFEKDMCMSIESTMGVSKHFKLPPQDVLFVKVGFLMSSDLVLYWQHQRNFRESEETQKNFKDMKINLESIDGQKWLYFRDFLRIQFSNQSVQKVPIDARIAIPEVVISTDSIDFQTCCIGQQKSREFILTNVSRSKSYLIISSEVLCLCCDSTVFMVHPTKIELEGCHCNTNEYKATVTIIFKPRKTGHHKCMLTLYGLMGEKPRTIDLDGIGSHDEKYIDMSGNR